LCVRLLQFKSDWRCRSPRRWLTLFNPLVSASSLKPRELGTAYSVVPCPVMGINIYNWLRFGVIFAVSRNSTARCWTIRKWWSRFENARRKLRVPSPKTWAPKLFLSHKRLRLHLLFWSTVTVIFSVFTLRSLNASQPLVCKWARVERDVQILGVPLP